MNCPICQKICQQEESPDHSIKYFCYCDQPLNSDSTTYKPPSFSAYRKTIYPHTCYYHSTYFRESHKLWMNFSYGSWSIFYVGKENVINVSDGQAQLNPWEAYRLLKRYQQLNTFT